MAVVTPLNNPGGPEGDTVTVDEQLLNTEYHRSYLGRFRERKHRAKNNVDPRVHWTLNTTHQFIIIATSMIS